MARRGPQSIYGQYRNGPARRRLPWWVYGLVAIPLVGLGVIGAYVGSVLVATKQAYDEVFVPSVRPTLSVPTATPEPPPTLVPGVPTTVAAPAPAPTATATPVILPEWEGTERLNVLLLGVDKREHEDVPRSDTMILVSIDPIGKRVGMMSIPRDLWVTIPGFGVNKINAAYPLGEMNKLPGGGPALAMRTVETNFRVPVHHFATVDFNGFVKVIDAIGGITVEVPYTLKDDAYPTDDGNNYTRFVIPAGLQHMDGVTALRYARSRNFDTDFGRQRRQQQVLQMMREQGVKLDLAPRLPEFITLLSGSVKTDLDPRQLPGLVSLGMSIDRENIKSYGITPDMLTVRETADIYYLEPSWPRINAALREMLGGTPRAEPAPVAPTPRPRAVATARPPEPPTPTPRPAATPTATRAPAEPTATRPAAAATRTVVPDRARVWVRNGTRVQGLAARAAEVLRSRGYTIVDVTQDPDAGKYPQSVVFVYGVERRDGVVLAQVLGLPAGAVRLGPAPAPPGTDILVILGDDAPRT